jgi:hypothetical protein
MQPNRQSEPHAGRRIAPTISVVIPSYNYGRYLSKAIHSVLDQDYPHKQLIVIDGGSSDDSLVVLQQLAPRLDVWVSEPDRGQTDALNKGFAHVRGELFVWLNADDAFCPGAFSAVAQLWRQGYDLIGGRCRNIDVVNAKQEIVASRPTTFCRYLDFVSSGFRGFLPQPAVFASTALARQAFPLTVGLRRAMDQQYFLRVLRQRPRQICSDQVFVDFLYHGDNLTTSEVPLLPELVRVTAAEIASLPWPWRPLQQRRLAAVLTLHHWLFEGRPRLGRQLGAARSQPLLLFHPLYWRLLAARLRDRLRPRRPLAAP